MRAAHFNTLSSCPAIIIARLITVKYLLGNDDKNKKVWNTSGAVMSREWIGHYWHDSNECKVVKQLAVEHLKMVLDVMHKDEGTIIFSAQKWRSSKSREDRKVL